MRKRLEAKKERKRVALQKKHNEELEAQVCSFGAIVSTRGPLSTRNNEFRVFLGREVISYLASSKALFSFY